MNTGKLREALAELQLHRSVLDAAIVSLESAIAMLEGSPTTRPIIQSALPINHRSSYIDDSVKIIRSAGKPLHMSELLTKLRELRGASIARNSVEASINRHISKTSGAVKLAKVAPSTYGLSAWKDQSIFAQTA
jgi:hypothetical protein